MNRDDVDIHGCTHGNPRSSAPEPAVRTLVGIVVAVLLASCGITTTGTSTTSTSMNAVTTSTSTDVTTTEGTSPPPVSTAPDDSHQVTPDDVTLMVPEVLEDIERVGWDSTHGAPYSSVLYFRGEDQYALHVTNIGGGFPIGEYVLGHPPPSPTKVISSAVGDLTVYTAEQLDWPDGGVVVASGICGDLELWQESRSSLDTAVSDLTNIIDQLDCR